MSQLTLDSEPKEIPIKYKNPKKDLSANQYKLYCLVRDSGPKTLQEIQRSLYIRPIKGLEKVSDIERMLRRIRDHKDSLGKPLYLRAVPQMRGYQKWEAVP